MLSEYIQAAAEATPKPRLEASNILSRIQIISSFISEVAKNTMMYTALISIIPLIAGNIIFQKDTQEDAPSMEDASYKAVSIFWSPAKNIKIGTPEYHRTNIS